MSEKSEIPKTIIIVHFTAFNSVGFKILEDVDPAKVEETIRRKTSNTAIIHSYTEYEISGRKEVFVSEDIASTKSMSEDLLTETYKKAYDKLQQDSDKRNNKDDDKYSGDIINEKF
jgi:hypothetical protein